MVRGRSSWRKVMTNSQERLIITVGAQAAVYHHPASRIDSGLAVKGHGVTDGERLELRRGLPLDARLSLRHIRDLV
jgi:hypothetical protein